MTVAELIGISLIFDPPAHRMFGIDPTPFDLQFRLGRIPVRVHPGFWIVGTIGGWHPEDLRLTFLWVMCLFVSILIHELGHAVVAEAFGWPSEILLYHFGGLAFSQRYYNDTPWRSIAVSLAGPFAGFALFGLIMLITFGLLFARVDVNEYVEHAFFYLIFVNLAWGLVNLAPVLPLDGGRVCESFLEWLRVRNFRTLSLQISLLVGGVMAALFLMNGWQFAGLLFVFLCLQNLAALQQGQGRW